jgi:hypothetical protein
MFAIGGWAYYRSYRWSAGFRNDRFWNPCYYTHYPKHLAHWFVRNKDEKPKK